MQNIQYLRINRPFPDFNFKIKVENEEQAKAFQLWAFDNDKVWGIHGKNISYANAKFFYVKDHITFGTRIDTFKETSYKEIKFDDYFVEFDRKKNYLQNTEYNVNELERVGYKIGNILSKALYVDTYDLRIKSFNSETTRKLISLNPKNMNNKDSRFPFKLNLIDARKIYNIACSEWKTKLEKNWAKYFLEGEYIIITEDEYKVMRNACNNKQHELFDEIFGKDKKEVFYSLGDQFTEDDTGEVYLLASVEDFEINLICLGDGGRIFAKSQTVKDCNRITENELHSLISRVTVHGSRSTFTKN